MRDPLGPPFQTNLIWGQRFIQLSLSCFTKTGAVQARAIPIDLHHCQLFGSEFISPFFLLEDIL